MYFSYASLLFISPSILPPAPVPPPCLRVQPPVTFPSLTSPVTITALLLFKTYASTNSKPTSHISSSTTSSKEGYSQLPYQSCRGCIFVRWWATLLWKIPRSQPMWRITTHISNPKRRSTWTKNLKNIPDTHMFTPSRHKIIGNLANIFCTFLIVTTITIY